MVSPGMKTTWPEVKTGHAPGSEARPDAQMRIEGPSPRIMPAKRCGGVASLGESPVRSANLRTYLEAAPRDEIAYLPDLGAVFRLGGWADATDTARPVSIKRRMASEREMLSLLAQWSRRSSISTGTLKPIKGSTPVGGRPRVFCLTDIDGAMFSV